MRDKYKVLFVCIQNSARSQMAEAFLKKFGGSKFVVESAGLEPGVLNPLVVKLMMDEEGIDISANKTKSAIEFFKDGRLFNYVVTVCDQVNAQKCPIFPGVRARIMMSFEDPALLEGTEEKKLERLRKIKNEIKEEVSNLQALIETGTIKENFPENWKLG